MPIYEYEIIRPDGTPGERFEYKQRMTDPPLTHHPASGVPVRRVLSAPRIAGKYSERAMKRAVSDDKKLDAMGFTKYVKTDKGRYEKRAGRGPNVISSGD